MSSFLVFTLPTHLKVKRFISPSDNTLLVSHTIPENAYFLTVSLSWELSSLINHLLPKFLETSLFPRKIIFFFYTKFAPLFILSVRLSALSSFTSNRISSIIIVYFCG